MYMQVIFFSTFSNNFVIPVKKINVLKNMPFLENKTGHQTKKFTWDVGRIKISVKEN